MKSLFLLSKLFVGQTGPDDCGIACMGMILKYAGKTHEAYSLFSEIQVPDGGMSLLNLRNLANSKGFSSRCVQMDTQTLRAQKSPCILHTVNEQGQEHFLVCFGARRRKGKYQYVIGDPAKHVTKISDEELEKLWRSKAALYFESLIPGNFLFNDHAWVALLNIKSFRKILLVSVPFLSICSSILGVALSWLLQRGINDSLADKKQSLIIAVVILLFFLTSFKGFIGFVRQKMLIILNGSVSEQLTNHFLEKVLHGRHSLNYNSAYVKKGLSDIQKIQNSLTAFVSILISEGTIITCIIAGLWYFLPEAGLINTIYIMALCWMSIKNTPEILYRTAYLNELGRYAENELISKVSLNIQSGKVADIDNQQENQSQYLTYAKSLAQHISLNNFRYESIGTVNVIIVFIICLQKTQLQLINYNDLMIVVILSYLITSIMPRICNATVVIFEGGHLVRRYQDN